MKIPIEVSTFFAEYASLFNRVEEIAVSVLTKIAQAHNGFFQYHKINHQKPYQKTNPL